MKAHCIYDIGVALNFIQQFLSGETMLVVWSAKAPPPRQSLQYSGPNFHWLALARKKGVIQTSATSSTEFTIPRPETKCHPQRTLRPAAELYSI